MSENICGFYFNLLNFLLEEGNYPKRVTVRLESIAIISECFSNKSTKTVGGKLGISQDGNIFSFY